MKQNLVELIGHSLVARTCHPLLQLALGAHEAWVRFIEVIERTTADFHVPTSRRRRTGIINGRQHVHGFRLVSTVIAPPGVRPRFNARGVENVTWDFVLHRRHGRQRASNFGFEHLGEQHRSPRDFHLAKTFHLVFTALQQSALARQRFGVTPTRQNARPARVLRPRGRANRTRPHLSIALDAFARRANNLRLTTARASHQRVLRRAHRVRVYKSTHVVPHRLVLLRHVDVPPKRKLLRQPSARRLGSLVRDPSLSQATRSSLHERLAPDRQRPLTSEKLDPGLFRHSLERLDRPHVGRRPVVPTLGVERSDDAPQVIAPARQPFAVQHEHGRLRRAFAHPPRDGRTDRTVPGDDDVEVRPIGRWRVVGKERLLSTRDRPSARAGASRAPCDARHHRHRARARHVRAEDDANASRDAVCLPRARHRARLRLVTSRVRSFVHSFVRARVVSPSAKNTTTHPPSFIHSFVHPVRTTAALRLVHSGSRARDLPLSNNALASLIFVLRNALPPASG